MDQRKNEASVKYLEELCRQKEEIVKSLQWERKLSSK